MSAKRPSVLIIDNDEPLVNLLAYCFEERGFTVHVAHDGAEGFDLALRHRPAAIVCDLIMHNMHGFEVLQKIRAQRELQDAFVVVVSAKSYKPDIDRALALGANDYLVKPFRASELVQLVESHQSFGAARIA